MRNNRLYVTPEEMNALTLLKQHSSFGEIQAAGMGHDWNLLRFLRARKLDPQKAFEMLSNAVAFFKRKDMDKINSDDYLPILQVFRKFYRHGSSHYDKEGRPVGIEMFSKSDPIALFNHVTPEQVEKYFIAKHERVLKIIFPVLSEFHNKRIEQASMVIDLKDLPISKLFSGRFKNFMMMIVKLNQDYYPEILGKMDILNAPFIFRGIWSIVKTWFDPRTGEKISIHSDYALKEIEKHHFMQFYPSELGGKCQDDYQDNPGPAHQFLMDSIRSKTCYLPDRALEFDWFYQPAELHPLGSIPRPLAIKGPEHPQILPALMPDPNSKILHHTAPLTSLISTPSLLGNNFSQSAPLPRELILSQNASSAAPKILNFSQTTPLPQAIIPSQPAFQITNVSQTTPLPPGLILPQNPPYLQAIDPSLLSPHQPMSLNGPIPYEAPVRLDPPAIWISPQPPLPAGSPLVEAPVSQGNVPYSPRPQAIPSGSIRSKIGKLFDSETSYEPKISHVFQAKFIKDIQRS